MKQYMIYKVAALEQNETLKRLDAEMADELLKLINSNP